MTDLKKTRTANAGPVASSSKTTVPPIITDAPNGDTLAFIDHFGGIDNRVTFQTFDDVKIDGKPRGRKNLARTMHGTLKGFYPSLKALNDNGAGVFLTINETDLQGRRNTNIIRARAVWQDDDTGQGHQTLPELAPTMVVESSPGKFHRYWMTDTENLQDWDAVQLTMTLEFGCDPACKDRARVLRIPGFIHQKDPSNPFEVKLINNDMITHAWEDLKGAIPPTVKPIKSASTSSIVNTGQPALAANNSLNEYHHSNMLSAINAYPLEPTEESFTLFTRAVAAAGCSAPIDLEANELVTSWDLNCKSVDGYDHDSNYKKLKRFIEETKSGKNLTPPEHIYKTALKAGWNRPKIPAPATTGLIIESFDQITEKSIEWLWPDHIPAGKLSIFGGHAGLNKSTLCLAIASIVTNGSLWPDGSTCDQGEVIIMSSEDDPSDTIKPRLRLAGADLKKVHYLSYAKEYDRDTKTDIKTAFSFVHHLSKLDALLKENPQIRLIVVDPITAFCNGLHNAHNASEIRSTLSPLIELLAEHGVAMLAIMHLNKSEGASAQHRFNGSGAWVQVARSVLLVERDPDDDNRRFLLPVKINLAPDRTGIGFEISIEENHPVVTWRDEPIELTADQFMGNTERSKKPSKLNSATAWLQNILRSGPMPKTEIDAFAKKADISNGTLQRAKDSARVQSRRKTGADPVNGWEWLLPEDIAEYRDDDNQGAQINPEIPPTPESEHLEHLDQ